jgi:hypothetical protein
VRRLSFRWRTQIDDVFKKERLSRWQIKRVGGWLVLT